MSMNPKTVAAGPRDKKVVEERLDGGSGFVCGLCVEEYAVERWRHPPGRALPRQPSHSSCEELIDDHVDLIVLLVRETPFLAKSHALRIMLTVRMLQASPAQISCTSLSCLSNIPLSVTEALTTQRSISCQTYICATCPWFLRIPTVPEHLNFHLWCPSHTSISAG